MKLSHRLKLAGLVVVVYASLTLAVGEAAVITLVFPPGARATGLAEAFVAVSDDANATFFNPAGLGQSPLANSWHSFYLDRGAKPTAIASKRKKAFGARDRVWVGTDKGLFRYNGKAWESSETYVIEEGDNLDDIAERVLDLDDPAQVRKAVRILRRENKIEINRADFLRGYLEGAITDTNPQVRTDRTEELVEAILGLPDEERNAAGIYGLLATRIDSVMADTLSDVMTKAFDMEDTKFADLVDLKIPFSIAVRESVTVMMLDGSERLWVGTADGLWRYDGSSWARFTTLDGLPSDHITALALGPRSEVAVGTENGLAILSEGAWASYSDQALLPALRVTALTFAETGELYIGTNSGLVRKADTAWTQIDTADGLLTSGVTALMYDSNDKLWIGGDNGVTIFDKASWKRYKFPDSHIFAIREYEDDKVWIGTNRGAITYQAGRTKTNREGNVVTAPPLWKFFHSKNALAGTEVYDVAVQGKDVWLVTDRAVNQYDYAEKQVLVFYEQLLPAFKLPDLWHIYLAGVIPTEDWGTIGAIVNYINFGEIEWTDEHGRAIGRARSWEGVFGITYGLPIKDDFSFGLGLKYVHSALAPGYGQGDEGIGRTFAVDASLLKRNLFVKGLSLGLNLQNMGPPIYYISRDDSDPIPFNVKFGLAYKIIQTPLIELQVLTDLNREIVKNYFTRRPDPFWKAIYTDLINDPDETLSDELADVIVHLGLEFWYANFLALRTGYMHDKAGYRKEVSIGLGLSYGNLSFDGSYIHSPREMSVARHGQWRISLLLKI